MSITVGTDTYITIAEADSYITNHFVSTDTQRVAWEALSDTDKEIHLRNSTIAMENLKFVGVKKETDQTLSFPRCFTNTTYFSDAVYGDYETKPYQHGYEWYCQVEVPDGVKNAQTHEAIELASPSTDTTNFNAYNGAVKSFSITGLSKSFNTTPQGSQGMSSVIKSKRAQSLLSRYMGVYRVY